MAIDDVLYGLGRQGLSGLSAAGAALDLYSGASSVRDIIGGQNPFDQFLSPFSWENRQLPGDQLNEWLGPLPSNAGFWDQAGRLGLDLAYGVGTDPLSWMTLGTSKALTLGGRAARATGQMMDDVARIAARTPGGPSARQLLMKMTPQDVIDYGLQRAAQLDPASRLVELERIGRMSSAFDDAARALTKGDSARAAALRSAEPISRMFGFGPPLMQPRVVGNLGPLGPLTAGALDVTGRALRRTPLVGGGIRSMEALFSAPVRGALEDETQAMLRARQAGARETAGATQSEVADILQEFMPALTKPDNLDELFQVREMLEGVRPVGGAYAAPVQRMRDMLTARRGRAADLGVKDNLLQDVIDYFPRLRTEIARGRGGVAGQGAARSMYELTSPFQMAREDVLRNWPGGTAFLSQLSKDARFSGTTAAGLRQGTAARRTAAEALREAYPTQTANQSLQRLEGLANYMARLDPVYAKEGIPLYSANPIEALSRRMQFDDLVTEGAMSFYDATEAATRAIKPGDITSTVDDLVHRVRGVLNPTRAKEVLAQRLSTTVDDVGRIELPRRLVDDMARQFEQFTSPKEISQIGHAWDWVTQRFKTGVTSLWPAFHTRNAASAFVNNVFGDAFDPRYSVGNPMRYGMPYADALGMMRGGTVKGANKIPGLEGLNAAEATKQLQNEIFSQNLISSRMGQAGELAAQSPDILRRMPGAQKYTPLKTTMGKIPAQPVQGVRSWIPGRTFLESQEFGPTTRWQMAAQEANYGVEGTARIAPYLAFRRQGMAPAEAARRVKMLQVDYGDLSAFEKKYMRRIFPFYSFSRGMSKYLADDLLRRPGGKMATAIKSTGRESDQRADVPGYLGSTTAIELGEPIPGTKRFLTGFGLAYEDPLGKINLSSPKDFFYNLAKNLNPLIRTPIEHMTGISAFHHGRPLAQADPVTGRIARNLQMMATGAEDTGYTGPIRFPGQQVLESGLQLTPASRLFSTIRTATDLRKEPWVKALNLGTGISITDVSPISRQRELRRRIEDELVSLGARRSGRVYLPDEAEAALDEEQQLLLQQLQMLYR